MFILGVMTLFLGGLALYEGPPHIESLLRTLMGVGLASGLGASLGLGLSESSYRLFQKLQWPDVGPVPCLVKPLSRRALRRPTWPVPVNRFVSYITLPWIRLVSRSRPLEGTVRTVRQFDDRFTRLWERVRDKFAFAVRRDAAYLNWKYIQPPHVRYSVGVLERGADIAGYVVYRHVVEPRGRVTLLVDFSPTRTIRARS